MSNRYIEPINFYTNATAPQPVGIEWFNDYEAETINIVASGTATALNATLEGKIGDIWVTLKAVNLDTYKLTNTIDTLNVGYQVDLTGFKSIRMNLISVDASVTIQGFAVK